MTKTLLASAALLTLLPAHADISVTAPAFTYSQSFDSLATTGTANAWTNDLTLAGWSLFTSAGAPVATYRADTGASNTGAIYSYGSTGSGERALGGIGSSGFPGGYIAVAFTNNTGDALDSFTLGFSGEQWRNGGNATAQTMVLEYGFGASFAGVTWVAPGAAFNFTSPVATTTAAAVDGNLAGMVAGLGGTVATPWAAGDTLWVRWIEVNDAGNDHGLAIDNFALNVTAVPEPEAWTLMLAGLAALGFIARRRG